MRRMISKLNPWAADMHLHTHLCVHCAAFKILCKIKCALYSLVCGEEGGSMFYGESRNWRFLSELTKCGSKVILCGLIW